jgi:hypothetical protein
MARRSARTWTVPRIIAIRPAAIGPQLMMYVPPPLLAAE